MSYVELKEFLSHWDKIPYPKPEVNPEFLPLFIEHLEDKSTTVQPDGDGSYFGKQALITDTIGYDMFELAFDQNQIVIYTARHSGFWVAPYATIKIGDPEFKRVAGLLRAKLIEAAGINLLGE